MPLGMPPLGDPLEGNPWGISPGWSLCILLCKLLLMSQPDNKCAQAGATAPHGETTGGHQNVYDATRGFNR